MTDHQLNEGVKEIVLSLLSLAANSYSINYVWNQLEKRPEPVEQKIEALKIADSKVDNSEFDNTVDTLLKYYVKKSKVNRSPNTISSKLVDFVKKHEQFSAVPYWDYKQYSIGYGTKAHPNDKTITRQEAENRLIQTIKAHRTAVINEGKKWGYNWSSAQIDALTSFRYNVGSLSQLTNNGKRNNSEIANKILEYDKAGGKPLMGLTNRRRYEQLMFVSRI